MRGGRRVQCFVRLLSACGRRMDAGSCRAFVGEGVVLVVQGAASRGLQLVSQTIAEIGALLYVSENGV